MLKLGSVFKMHFHVQSGIIRSSLILLVSSIILSGCGLAGVGVIAAATGGGGGGSGPIPAPQNDAPTVFVTTPGRQVGDIAISYKLVDNDADNCSITVKFGIGGASPDNAATPAAGSEPVTGLTSSIAGVSHTFIWDSLADVGAGYKTGVSISIVATDGKDNSVEQITGQFEIGNDAPVVEGLTPDGVQSGDIAVVYTAKDTSSDGANLEIEFRLDNVSAWTPAKPLTGIPVSGIITAPDPGIQHVFVWDSYDNVGGVGSAVSLDVQVRLRLNDVYDNGAWTESTAFTVNNNQPPFVQFTSIGDVSEEKLVGIIPIRYRLLDEEADVCSVVVEGSLDGSVYFALEEFPAGYENKSYSQGTTNLSSSQSGDEHLFLWHPYANRLSTASGMYIRISVSDAYNSGNPAQIFTTKRLSYRQNGSPQDGRLLTDTNSPLCMASGDFNNDGIDDLIVGNNAWDNCSIFAGKLGNLPSDGDGVTVNAGARPSKICVGDFDNDGIADFMIVRQATLHCYVYRGKDLAFPTGDPPWILETGSEPADGVVGDFNGDGIDDFGISSKNDLSVKLYLGVNGSLPSNTSAIDLPTGNYARITAAGDINNDGIDDLVALNSYDNDCTIFPGKTGTGPSGGDGFNLPTNDMPSAICFGDFNGDGLLDFAISCAYSNNIIVYEGKTGEFPGPADGISLDAGNRPFGIGTGDFNGDGIDDMVVTNIVGGTLTIYAGQEGAMPQNGQGIFVSVNSLPTAYIIDDFNNDGLDDIIVMATNVRFYAGMAGLFFSEDDAVLLPLQGTARVITAGDFNGDGISDVAFRSLFNTAVYAGYQMTAPKADEEHTFPAGRLPWRGEVCDINNDGVDDIVTANYVGKTLTVQPGKAGAFPLSLDAVNLTAEFGPVWVASGDFNMDGIDDIAALAGILDNQTAMLFAGKDGELPLDGEATYVDVPAGTADVAVGDFNDDGIADLLTGTGEPAGEEFILYPGKSGQMPLGNEGITYFGPVAFGGSPRLAFAVGDYNCDGIDDFASANFYGDDTTILAGQSGAFPMECQSVILPTRSGPAYVVTGDFNSDGIDDLIFAHETTKDILIYPGQDGGMPKAADGILLPPIPLGGTPYAMDVGDFNADGIDDMIVVHEAAGSSNASVYFGRLGNFPILGADITVPLDTGPEDVISLDINGDGIDDFVTANGMAKTQTVYLGRPDQNMIPLTRTTLASGENPHSLNVMDANGDGLKTFVALDRDAAQCIMYKRFLCSPCLTFMLTPQAVIRKWKNDYWRLSVSIPAGAVTENEVAYMMHVDYLDLPERSAVGRYYRHASTAVKFMPETLAFQGGNKVTVTMPFLDGISQADIDYAKSKDIVRVYRWEREIDNGDGTFGKLADISAGNITEIDIDKRTVTFTTDRLGVFQLGIEYVP